MSFSEKLNEYMDKYSLSSNALTNATGLSKSTISRFKNGKQEPPAHSTTLHKLSSGIANLIGCNEKAVYKSLANELKNSTKSFEQTAENLNRLISTLDINANDLSRFLNYDPSYLSRIRSLQRKPSNITEFCEGIAAFTSKHYNENISALAILLNCDENDISDISSLKSAVLRWLLETPPASHENRVKHFLEEVDKFDLNEYIRKIHFDKIKVPTIPFSLPGSKSYYNLSGFMKAELDWIKSTVLSSSKKSVIMYSDMPMSEMGKDKDFSKKIIAGMAMMLKKGLHLNVIHNIDRPFNELLMGLEGWIPLYMTGQVLPYYFKGKRDNVFNHFERVSGAAALSGESIVGKHENGKYYLTKNKDEIAYYRQRGEDMLGKADPLMEIYTVSSAKEYTKFLKNEEENRPHYFRNILSSPPLYTISKELLTLLLKSNNIYGEALDKIILHYKDKKLSLCNTLKKSPVNDEVLMLTREEFEQYPVVMPLADIFTEKEVYYTYEEYCKHIELTKLYAEKTANYQCTITKSLPFRNIQIRVAEGEYAIVSKNISPAIHFVIRHQKLRRAIEHMILSDK